jgi:hypothetical protein
MSAKTTRAVVGAVVALAVMANAVMAEQAGAGTPRQEFKGPVKVFILSGQSNMQGHANILTFDYIGKDPLTAPILAAMRDTQDKPRVCENVRI